MIPFESFRTACPVLVLWLLAGCTEISEPHEEELPDPGMLRVPNWTEGQHWEYRTGTGNWQNWTVVGREVVHGRDSYKVRVEFTPSPGYERLTEYNVWHDAETLGQIALELGRGETTYDVPLYQMFPMTSRDYGTTQRGPGSSSQDVRVHLEVLGWEDILTATATRSAVRLETQYETGGARVMWYNPDVAGLLAYELDEYYALASYG